MSRGALARKHSAGEELGLEGGLLCQLVRSPDYNLFPNSAVFESNFIQVTKKGKWVDITNSPTIVTMGVTSSDPCLPLPNVLLMGRHRVPIRRSHSKALRRPPLELTRLLPLRYVRLSVHDEAQRILRIQTVTGKVYYLQLHQEHPHAVFALWSRLAEILQKGLSITTKDPNIRIRHSLVPSGSSPSSSSSGEYVDRATRGRSAMKKAGKKVTGALAHISKSPPKDKGKRKVSFQGDYNDELSALSNDIKGAPLQCDLSPPASFTRFPVLCPSVLFYDMPAPLVCARCKGRLSKMSRRHSRERRPSETDLDLLPWMDSRSYGLWQQETPSWLQPLNRLSSLAAAGLK
ncbi:Golgi-associated RAB2 interactor protein 1A-like isoform X1 [Podarcis raffonei]|uniref:Golgi-associated RAB2 interactor protein 1A-like isoform X1 n=1 Tax=Podarcis raffonei TaxID=65483 RepID=UPI002329552C|nr:Golgi-associated RAB2 interactor protein 1A-like isoform X1 [Podarcis raffonei]